MSQRQQHPAQSQSNVNEIYFTGPGDPRNRCVAIGFQNNVPVLYKFDTVELAQGIRTTVKFNQETDIAYLDWELGNHLGSVVRGKTRTPMADFVARGSANNARQFKSTATDGVEVFEWRRLGNMHPFAYELISITPNGEARIATYDITPKEIPGIGRAYAYLQYTFPEEALLRDALLALCLNRWIDWKGM